MSTHDHEEPTVWNPPQTKNEVLSLPEGLVPDGEGWQKSVRPYVYVPGNQEWYRTIVRVDRAGGRGGGVGTNGGGASTDPRADYAYEHQHGGMSKQAYEDDPRRLEFHLARYKHTAKLLEGFDRVLEVGCADGFGTRVVRQHVGHLTAIDPDLKSIEEARRAASSAWPIEFLCADVRDAAPGAFPLVDELPRWEGFDAVYALDVLEHIRHDAAFLCAMRGAAPVAVIGTPSKESQQYASPLSKLGHCNCYSGTDLRHRLLEYWDQVFVLTMNDETLGTGYYPMAQYLLALCVRS